MDERHPLPVQKLICDDLAKRPMRQFDPTPRTLCGLILAQHVFRELPRLGAFPVPAPVETLTQLVGTNPVMRTVTHA